MLSAALTVSLTSAIQPISAKTDSAVTQIEYLLNPNTNRYCVVRDISEEIAELSSKNERDFEFEKKFEQKRKLEAIQSVPRKSSVINNGLASVESTAPVPGGVGYGVFYRSNFQSDIGNGTTLSYDIVCPTKAGGDVNTYLYLTSTNRAAKGVEAFISYYSQDNLRFRIFDWARPEEEYWQTNLSYSDLSDYLSTKNINNSSHQVISIQNRTEKISNTKWRNVVWLWNYSTQTYDNIYSYTYDATSADQYDSHYGSWGPIVETFQSSYNENTNDMGFYLSQVMTKNSNNTWGSWQLLDTGNSRTRNDGLGLNAFYSISNHTFLVH